MAKQPVAEPAHAGATGTATVTIACKHPPGFELKVYDVVQQTVVDAKGAHMENMCVARDRSFFVRGPAKETDKPATCLIAGGYAITRGIPEDFWDLYCKQNKGAAWLKEGPNGEKPILFAMNKQRDAIAAAVESKIVRSGMEPMKKVGDPRDPGKGRGVKIEPDETADNQFFFEDEEEQV